MSLKKRLSYAIAKTLANEGADDARHDDGDERDEDQRETTHHHVRAFMMSARKAGSSSVSIPEAPGSLAARLRSSSLATW